MTALADPPSFISIDPPMPAEPSAMPRPIAVISADLMPDEIRVKRRLGYLKRRLVFVMAALIALVVLGDLLVRQQTNSVGGDLAGANDHITALNSQLNSFDKVLAVQSQTQAIWTQLDGVMANDISWPALLNRLATPAPAGLRLTTISGQVNGSNSSSGTTSGSGASPLTVGAIGSITLTGNAPDWKAVAAYVRGLSDDRDFTAVNPSSVSNGSAAGASSLTFTVTLDLTSSVLSNRYTSTPSPSTTSGTTGSTSSQPVVKTLHPAGSGKPATRTAHRSATRHRGAATNTGTTGNTQEVN